MSKIVFLGSQNIGGIADDGETIKNMYLKKGISKYVDSISVIDVRNKPSRILYLAKFLVILLFSRNRKVIISASAPVAHRIMQVIKILRYNPKNCYYWVIGGSAGRRIEKGIYNASLYRDLQQIIVEGDSMRQEMNRAGLNNVMQLPNMKPVDYLPQKVMRRDSTTRFIFLSRIMPEKGVNYIIEAANKLLSEGICDFSISFCGKIDSGYEKQFKKAISNNAHLINGGFVNLSTPEGYDFLATFDVMLFPSYYSGEGFPGVIIDAYIAGLPVIASDWSINKDLIDENKTGFVCKVHDIDDLIKSMKRVINKEVDIVTMSRNAQAKAKEFDIDNVITENLLKQIKIIE